MNPTLVSIVELIQIPTAGNAVTRGFRCRDRRRNRAYRGTEQSQMLDYN
jgi:hypothetical protein